MSFSNYFKTWNMLESNSDNWFLIDLSVKGYSILNSSIINKCDTQSNIAIIKYHVILLKSTGARLFVIHEYKCGGFVVI